jgi:hypothetical protein
MKAIDRHEIPPALVRERGSSGGASSPLVATAGMFVVVACIAGCGGGDSTWTITAENLGDVPCNVEILYGEDGSRSARVEQLAKGKPHTLVGETVPAKIRTVSVVRGDKTLTLEPNVPVPLGKRNALVIAADGAIRGEVVCLLGRRLGTAPTKFSISEPIGWDARMSKKHLSEQETVK